MRLFCFAISIVNIITLHYCRRRRSRRRRQREREQMCDFANVRPIIRSKLAFLRPDHSLSYRYSTSKSTRVCVLLQLVQEYNG